MSCLSPLTSNDNGHALFGFLYFSPGAGFSVLWGVEIRTMVHFGVRAIGNFVVLQYVVWYVLMYSAAII